ncbi:MAG TPA: sulfur carrier protein ThiS [Mycobacteriales bacterium]|nr:sulfur carrier protein ThiS [Mycobacteriales bacterium]
MSVYVNGQPRDLGAGATVADVVHSLGAGGSGVAVAVNDEVVPRTAWARTRLRDDDRIEVLTAVQGG